MKILLFFLIILSAQAMEKRLSKEEIIEKATLMAAALKCQSSRDRIKMFYPGARRLHNKGSSARLEYLRDVVDAIQNGSEFKDLLQLLDDEIHAITEDTHAGSNCKLLLIKNIIYNL